MKLSNQAVGAIMMALQKGILEQTDITGVLKDFDMSNSADGLIVENPPTFSLNGEKKETKKKTRRKRTTKKKASSKEVKMDA
jgi:hypothetical protein